MSYTTRLRRLAGLLLLAAVIISATAHAASPHGACNPVWQTPLTVANAGSGSGSVTIGLADSASAGYDSGCDVIAPPPPPSPVFDVRLATTDADDVFSDYQHDLGPWTLAFNAGSDGYPVTVSWDPAALPFPGLRLRDAFGGALGVDVDMDAVAGYTLPDAAPYNAIDTLQIVYTGTCAAALRYWGGGTNSDWHEPAAWGGLIPDTTTTAVMPPGTSAYLSTDAQTGCLLVGADAAIDLAAYTMTVEHSVHNAGTLLQTRDVPAGPTTSFLTLTNQAGDATRYFGVDITPAAGMGTTTVSVSGRQVCPTGGLGEVARCFTITPATPATATSRFYYTAAEAGANSDPDVWHYDADTTAWEYLGATAGGGSGDGLWVEATTTDYSPFALSDDGTLPVTLAYVDAAQSGATVTVRWQTATETGTVGFNLVGITADGSRIPLTDRAAVATGVATVVPQSYSRTVRAWGGASFYIEDVGIRGEVTRHGPFTVGEPSGRRVEPTAIDWRAIQAEHAALADARQAAALDGVRRAFSPTLQPNAAGSIDVLVRRSGLQRITYADLIAFGVDPAGLPANRIALRLQGQPLPITIRGGSTVGPNTVIEFIGTAVDSLYSDTNRYSLTINPADALRIGRDTGAVPTVNPVPFYLETVTVEEENSYSLLSPNGDPWYAEWLMAHGGSFAQDFTLTADHLTTGADAVLHLDVWGLSDWPVAGDDHRLQVTLNGTLLADVTFDGLVSQVLDLTLPEGLLVEGDNTLTLTVPEPADPEIAWDIIILDSYGVTYPRAFVVTDNALTFTAAGEAFEVDGLTVLMSLYTLNCTSS